MKKQIPFSLKLILLVLSAQFYSQIVQADGKKRTEEVKPKNIIVGTGIGGLNISGDVRSKTLFNQPINPNNTVGIDLLGQFRLYDNFLYAEINYIQGKAHGYNCNPSNGYATVGNQNENNPWVRTGYTQGVNYNYLAKLKMLNLGVVVSTNNNRRFSANFGIGGGFVGYTNWVDALDSRGQSYASGFKQIADKQNIEPSLGLKACNTDVRNLFDGEYDSPAEREDLNSVATIVPSLTVSIGVAIKLSSMLSIELRNKVFFTGDDLIDGQQWQERAGFTQDADNVNYLSLGLRVAW